MKYVLPAMGLPALVAGFLWTTTAGEVVCICEQREEGVPPAVWLLQYRAPSGTVQHKVYWQFVKRGHHLLPRTELRLRRGADVLPIEKFIGKSRPESRPQGGAA